MSGAVVFVDRDGTLIRDVGYLCRSEQIEILQGVPEGLRLLCEHGLKVVVVTNQSAVARGLISEEELGEIHRVLQWHLTRRGSRLDAIYYCPHHPTEGKGEYRVSCDCRKPGVGLVERARQGMGLRGAISYVVGDQQTDMELAARIGGKGVWLRGPSDPLGWQRGPGVASVQRDFRSAACWIVRDWLEIRGE